MSKGSRPHEWPRSRHARHPLVPASAARPGAVGLAPRRRRAGRPPFSGHLLMRRLNHILGRSGNQVAHDRRFEVDRRLLHVTPILSGRIIRSVVRRPNAVPATVPQIGATAWPSSGSCEARSRPSCSGGDASDRMPTPAPRRRPPPRPPRHWRRDQAPGRSPRVGRRRRGACCARTRGRADGGGTGGVLLGRDSPAGVPTRSDREAQKAQRWSMRVLETRRD